MNLQEPIDEIANLHIRYEHLEYSKKDCLGNGGCGFVYKGKHMNWGPIAFKKLIGVSDPNR